MKISKSIFAVTIAFAFLMTSCRETPTKNEEYIEEHGHEHDAEGNHMDDGPVEQEDFQIEKDSLEINTGTHSHDNGSEHHDH